MARRLVGALRLVGARRVGTPFAPALLVMCATLAAPVGCTRAEPAPAATIDVTATNFAELLDALTQEGQANRDPAAANAYPIILDACKRQNDAFAAVSSDYRIDVTAIYDEGVTVPGGTHDDAVKVATAALDELDRAGVFDLLDRAADAPRAARSRLDSPERDGERAALGSTDKWNGNLMGAMLPEIQSIRTLARACAARMHVAAGAKDPDAFVRALTQGLALSRAEFHQPWMIDAMVGASIRELIVTRAIADLGELELSAAQLETLQAAVDTQTRGLPGADFGVRGERLALLDMCRWAFDSRGTFQPKRLVEAGLIANLPKKGDPAYKATRDANVPHVEACYVDILAAAVQPRATRPDVGAAVRAQIAAGPSPDVVMLDYVGASGRYFNVMDGAALNLTGFRVVIAVERFERANGRYPDSLDEVVAQGLLEQIPTDAITSTPIRYRRLDAAEVGAGRAGRGYLVYSVGADGVDDAGRESADMKTDVRFDAAAGKGFDYVINAAR